jgi:hypothetical protein
MRLEIVEVLTALALTERQLGRIDSATARLQQVRKILERCPDRGPPTRRPPRGSAAPAAPALPPRIEDPCPDRRR